MKTDPDTGYILRIETIDAQNGVVHVEPDKHTDVIQVGANETKAVHFVEDFIMFLASRHNAVYVGCKECGWEGFIGPGEKAGGEGNKALVDEGSCPECSGDLINLQKQEGGDETEALDIHYEESEIIDD